MVSAVRSRESGSRSCCQPSSAARRRTAPWPCQTLQTGDGVALHIGKGLVLAGSTASSLMMWKPNGLFTTAERSPALASGEGGLLEGRIHHPSRTSPARRLFGGEGIGRLGLWPARRSRRPPWPWPARWLSGLLLGGLLIPCQTGSGYEPPGDARHAGTDPDADRSNPGRPAR